MRYVIGCTFLLIGLATFAPSDSFAKNCLRSKAEYWSKSAQPYWAQSCYEAESELLTEPEETLYRQHISILDCRTAREIYETAFRRRHPELPLEIKFPLDEADWMEWIIEHNAHDLYFCFTARKLLNAEAEIARLKLEVPPFPDLVEALRFDPEGRRPPAISDLYAAIVDLWFLAEADHPGAQALLAEVALLKDRTALAPGYALFLIERATWKGHRIANVDELRRRAAAKLPEDAIDELTALAARPDADFFDWLVARRKAGTLPQ